MAKHQKRKFTPRESAKPVVENKRLRGPIRPSSPAYGTAVDYFHEPIRKWAVEGMNNKAKVVSRRCYGFRTASTYIKALYHSLGKLPEPKMVHRFL